MKIAMYNLTTTCRFGGVETFVWNISGELARRGEEVHVIGGRGALLKDIPGVRVIRFPFWPRHRVPDLGTRFRKLVERWSFGIFALPVLVREKYDIIHIHKPYDLPFGMIAKKWSGSRLVFGSHGTDFFWGDRAFARSADILVSCSHFNGRDIERRYGTRPRIIYNGIDPEIFHPLPADPELQMELKSGHQENKIIVYVGRLIGLKGVGDLMRAGAAVAKRLPVRLVIIGDGEGRRDLQNLSRELGIEDKVVFAGYVPNREIPRFFSVADLGVFPSLADETFGLSICEAMACGLAPVATRVGGIPELIVDGETGLLAEPTNAEDLAEKVSRLLLDDALRRRMGERALERVRQLFTWEKVADRLEQAYADIWPEKRNRK